MELISGLPEDIARDCLIRISYQQFPAVASVSKRWNTEIHSPEFHRRRRSEGHAQNILVTVQSRFNSEKSKTGLHVKTTVNPVYQLSVFEPETGIWSELPMAHEFSGGLPLFCQIACVGYNFVVMGGWDPKSLKASNSVFIYDFLSSTWRRGVDMPGGSRTFFSCVSDYDRMVYVVGGHDEEKNALKSAFAYDVSSDVWVPLPDMARERDECKAVFNRRGTGTPCVVGGYCTEMQGRFERSAEVFDVASWKWVRVIEEFLDDATCPRACVDGGDSKRRMYMCRGGDVVVLEGDTWHTLAKLPSEIGTVACVEVWEGALLVIGSSGFGEPHMGFVLNLKSGSWTKQVSPDNYTGHVQCVCLLEI